MHYLKICSIVVVILLSGCASSGKDKLPMLTKDNYEAYTKLIVRTSMKKCMERVQSITQELEACTYQLANKYFLALYKEGKMKRPIYLERPKA